MRTNIDLDEELLEKARSYTTARTKKALVEEALRTFVEVKALERKREQYRRRLQELDARLETLDLDPSPSEILRADRSRR